MSDSDFREIERDRDARLADEAGEASSASPFDCDHCGDGDALQPGEECSYCDRYVPVTDEAE